MGVEMFSGMAIKNYEIDENPFLVDVRTKGVELCEEQCTAFIYGCVFTTESDAITATTNLSVNTCDFLVQKD